MPWGDKGGWQSDNQGPWGRPSGGGSGGGGKPGGDTPPPQGPDIDELLRRSAETIKRYMSGGSNKESGKGALLFVVIALLLWMSSGIYFVKADEQGVVKRF